MSFLDISLRSPLSVMVQLEFSLLALRDDPLPALQSQLHTAQSNGNHESAAEVLSLISNENSKRKRWAVSN